MLKYLLEAAYSSKKSFSYHFVSNILRSKNKIIKKHLGRRVKREIKIYAKNKRINLGFNNVIQNEKTEVECFSSDLNTAIIYFNAVPDYIYEFYKKYLLDDCLFLDVGANVGIHTLIALAANKRVFVHSFEPSPQIFSRLEKNIKKNTADRVELHQLAASNSNGFVFFQDCSEEVNIGISHISSEKTGLKVQSVTIDSLLNEVEKRICLVKIDVEGYEPGVLEGARNRLLRDKPVITLEFNRRHYPLEDICEKIPYDHDILLWEKSRFTPIKDFSVLNKIKNARDIVLIPRA
ncbi:FkbM family methyltransferase [uncultured Porticoccus sp.]|uniref:FkbM family methyltransferase n=1 Tax=uncultured Porticoccus sp. TaxID=1256050 RepID=UPI0030DC86AE|tara:strand:+ start:1066 stop:1941 length:876 start_codon:yes stop_codon:yes gene_type:complete